MQTIPLPVELINNILRYLSQQPYANVAQLIDGIQKAANPPTPSPIVPEKVARKNGPAESQVPLE